MAPDVRATTDITSVVGNYYDKLMLERLTAATVLYPQVEKKPIPKGTGKTINFNRYTNFPVSVLPLTEGEVPTQTYLSGSSVTSTIVQLGAWTPISDLLEMTSFSNVVKECVENMADNAAITVDSLIYLRMLADTTYDESPQSAQSISTWFYGVQGGFSSLYMSATGALITSFATLYSTLSAVSTTGIAGGHDLDLDKISRMAAKLRSNNCKPFEDGYYKLYTHPKAVAQIQRTSEWASWQIYTRPEVMDKGEVGRAHGVKIYESTIPLDVVARTSAPWAAGVSGIWNVIFGKGGIAVTELAGAGKPEIITKTTNKYDTSNPLNQWSTIGWKVAMTAKVLNKNCGYAFLTLTN